MKHYYLYLTLLITSCAFSQNMEWQWGNAFETITHDHDHLAVADSQGNVYSYGTFTGPSAIIGNEEIQNVNANSRDTYFVKYNPDGQLMWIRHIGGAGSDEINSIATDAAGNIYVTGLYRWSGIQFGEEFFPGTGMFLAKYNTDGDLLWVKTGQEAYIYDMEVTPAGDIYIGGTFSALFNFGGVTIVGEEDSSHIFIAKLDAAGDAVWVKNATGPVADFENNLLTSLAVDNLGNVYITGWFRTHPITFGDIVLQNNYWATMYLVKYDSEGNALWAKTNGNFNCVTDARGLSVNAQGEIYLSGWYCGTLQFGTTTLNAVAGTKYFIVKYTPDGQEQWAKTTTGNFSRIISSVLDSAGRLYVSGTYMPPFNLGNNISLTTQESGIFVARYASDGTPEWVTGSSAQDINAKVSMALVSDNTIIVAGSMPFNELELGDIVIENSLNSTMVFVAKLSDEELDVKENVQSTILIYPNPADDIIKVQTTSTINQLTIFDYNGRKVAENKNNSSLNISGLTAGIYLLSIATDTATYYQKVVIK